MNAKNPVSGVPLSITFGTEPEGNTDCATSFLAFNAMGEGALLNGSRFTFYSDSYKKPELVNWVSFYDRNGTLEVTHHLPPQTSVHQSYWGSAYKQFTASGAIAFPLQRQRAVPERHREAFSNALDLDGKFPITTEVVLATATKASGVKIIEHPSICGAIGCNSLTIIAALDNGKIWLSLSRVLDNTEVATAVGKPLPIMRCQARSYLC